MFRTYPTQLQRIPPPATVTECAFTQRHRVYGLWKNPEGSHTANTKMCEWNVLYALILFAINNTSVNEHVSIHEILIPWIRNMYSGLHEIIWRSSRQYGFYEKKSRSTAIEKFTWCMCQTHLQTWFYVILKNTFKIIDIDDLIWQLRIAMFRDILSFVQENLDYYSEIFLV